MTKPRLTIKQILAWADAHHKRTGCWPTSRSGSIHGTKDENWNAVNHAAVRGIPRPVAWIVVMRATVEAPRRVGPTTTPGSHDRPDSGVGRCPP